MESISLEQQNQDKMFFQHCDVDWVMAILFIYTPHIF